MRLKKNSRLMGGVLVLVGVGLLSVLYTVNNQSVANSEISVSKGEDGITTMTNRIEAARQAPDQDRGPAGRGQAQRLAYPQDPVGNESQSLTNQPIRSNSTPSAITGCSADALAIGIKHYKYPEAISSDLVAIQGGRKLHRDAAAALQLMMDAANRDQTTLTIGSAFRSIAYQQGIVDRKKGQGQSNRQIYSVSAPAGHSEHQTGYVVDFSPIESSFAQTKAYRWLQANAKQFGWEQSFTPEYSKTSGVLIEPWHWRYIGTEQAKKTLARSGC